MVWVTSGGLPWHYIVSGLSCSAAHFSVTAAVTTPFNNTCVIVHPQWLSRWKRTNFSLSCCCIRCYAFLHLFIFMLPLFLILHFYIISRWLGFLVIIQGNKNELPSVARKEWVLFSKEYLLKMMITINESLNAITVYFLIE